MKLSGLEPVQIGEGSLFVNVGERTNVTGSKAFARMILNGQYGPRRPVAWQGRGAPLASVDYAESGFTGNDPIPILTSDPKALKTGL